MAYKWPPHDPSEIKTYSIDWSRLIEDDTIETVQWFVEAVELGSYDMLPGDSLQLIQPTNTNTVTSVRVHGGTPSKNYIFTCKITTAAEEVYLQDVYLQMRHT